MRSRDSGGNIGRLRAMRQGGLGNWNGVRISLLRWFDWR